MILECISNASIKYKSLTRKKKKYEITRRHIHGTRNTGKSDSKK